MSQERTPLTNSTRSCSELPSLDGSPDAVLWITWTPIIIDNHCLNLKCLQLITYVLPNKDFRLN